MDTAGVFGPRKADGSLPDVKFMHLSADSKLIDKGKDVGLPFAGSAPDLGAFEYREPSSITIAVPSQKTPQSVMDFPGVLNSGEYIIYDLSGRRIPSGMIDRTYSLSIHDGRTPPGSRHASTILHVR